jgi:hypothetical protein
MMSEHEVTRTYYKDGKIVFEFIPPEDFFVDPTVELRAAIATLTQRVAELEAALREIDKVHYGLDLDDTDEERGDYWSALVLRYRSIARKSLARAKATT